MNYDPQAPWGIMCVGRGHVEIVRLCQHSAENLSTDSI